MEVQKSDRAHEIWAMQFVTMYMYSCSSLVVCGEEEEKYISAIAEENPFKLYEQKLLLLALTYRICSMYNRKLVNDGEEAGGRKNEVFIRLIQLIEKYYMQEREWNFMRINSVCLLNIFLRFQKVYAGIQYRNLYSRRLSVKVSRC